MHAVAFPDVSVPPNLGPAGTPQIVIDRSGMTNIVGCLQIIISHWNPKCALRLKELKRIVNALAPTVVVRRTLADDTYDAEHAPVRLTDEQRRAFVGLRRARRAAVFGGPGTGKTLLASEKAAQLAEDGHKTLLVCYNALLAQALARSKVLENVQVSTYHSLCFSVMKKAGLAIPSPVPDAWWSMKRQFR
ncbi:MAG: AAA family ATPase [Alphaproteobacteria bacterium]|nr:AAA family ATPase [Alphaproteobacteria bacterium]